jgi:hypothetical protein
VHGIGGFAGVATLVALNAIPVSRRRLGCMVYVVETNTVYTPAPLDLSTWLPTGLAPGSTKSLSAVIEAPADGTVKLLVKAPWNGYIGYIAGATSSGSISAEVQIDGVAVTFDDPVAFSTTPADYIFATGNNVVAFGQEVSIIFSSASSPENLSFVLGIA